MSLSTASRRVPLVSGPPTGDWEVARPAASGRRDRDGLCLFRVIQGLSAALMIPAALAVVVSAFPLRERGKALAIFFGISGGLTAIILCLLLPEAKTAPAEVQAPLNKIEQA